MSYELIYYGKLGQFGSLHLCLYISEETLKAVCPYYLVSMSGGSKLSHTPAVDSLILENDHSKDKWSASFNLMETNIPFLWGKWAH